MYKKCVYLKQKMNRTLFCKRQNKVINISECNGCEYKELQTDDSNFKSPIRKRSNRQNKREKERYSIIYQDLTKCCICPSKTSIEKNEIFEGAYRQTSIKWGAVAPLCNSHHKQFHNDRLFNLKFKVKFQKELIKIYGYEWYMEKFKINYEYLLNKKRTME